MPSSLFTTHSAPSGVVVACAVLFSLSVAFVRCATIAASAGKAASSIGPLPYPAPPMHQGSSAPSPNAADDARRRDPEPPRARPGDDNDDAANALFGGLTEGPLLFNTMLHAKEAAEQRQPSVSESAGFDKAAKLFLSSISEHVDPCDDFFEFSCGKWIENNVIPDDLTSYGHFSALRENVNNEMRVLFEDPAPSTSLAINTMKHIYRACMDTDRLRQERSKPLLRKLESFGHWPVIHGALWRESSFDLSKLLIQVGRSRATDVFHDVYVSLNQKNVSERLLHFDQGSLGLGSSARDYYLNETRYHKQLSAYRTYMIAKIQLLAEDAGSSVSHADIARSVDEIFEFEKRFAQIQVPEEQRRNYTKMYNVKRLSDMRKIIPEVNWAEYFGWMVPDTLRSYIESDPPVIVTEPEFFAELTKLLKTIEPRIITNYVGWRYVSAWSLQLDERFDDIQQDFLKVFIGKNKRSPRWKDCVSAASNKMSYASGAMYVRRYFDKNSKKVAMEMIEDLRAEFRDMLRRNDWMDAATRDYALEKANEMIPLIAYPDEFTYNDTALDIYYKDFTLKDGDSYADITESSSEWAQKKAFRRLAERVDRHEFGTSAAVVNAFYSGVKNAITFPAAILQPPFFDESFPRAVNYGAIGAVIGHEITHGFDDQGSQFDKIGNLKDWWAPSTSKQFVERKRCIIDQYSAFAVPETNGTMRINGILTQGENIADNGGIKQAFNAYRRHVAKEGGREEPRIPGLERYTPNQLFFMSFAQVWCGSIRPEAAVRQLLTDPHSPSRFRVNGVLHNQHDFAEAFSCPIGSPMNPGPEQRCAVW